MTHFCVSKVNIIGWGNFLSPVRCLAIFGINDDFLSIESFRTYIHRISIKNYHTRKSIWYCDTVDCLTEAISSRPQCVKVYVEGILPKGPYLPCVSMAGRALLAVYPWYVVEARFKTLATTPAFVFRKHLHWKNRIGFIIFDELLT